MAPPRNGCGGRGGTAKTAGAGRRTREEARGQDTEVHTTYTNGVWTVISLHAHFGIAVNVRYRITYYTSS